MNKQVFKRSAQNLLETDITVCTRCIYDERVSAPLVWAMINGETKTGITLFKMDVGVDVGQILGPAEEVVEPRDTIATLYARIEERGLELIEYCLPKLAGGSVRFITQDEAQRRIRPQRSPEDGCIDWSRSAEFIDRFTRAQTKPYPGAFTQLGDKPLHIWVAQPVLGTEQGG